MLPAHLYGLILLLSLFIGVAALTLGILSWLRSKEQYLKYFLFVLGAFNLKFLIEFFWSYAILNLPGFPHVLFRAVLTGSCTADFLFIFFLVLVWNSFFSLDLPHIVFAATGLVLSLALYLMLGTGTYESGAMTYRPGLPAGIGNLMAVLVFLLPVITGFTRLPGTLGKERRYFLLVTLLCSCAGLIQMAGSMVIRFLSLPDLSVRAPRPDEIGFPLLSVYFGLYTAAVMYFYLKYHLLPSGRTVSPASDDRTIHAAVDRFCAEHDVSAREREILILALDGFGNEEIGRRLFISTGTVKTHMHNIFRKTGTGSRTHLIRQVLGITLPPKA